MFTEWKSKASLSYLHCFSVLARRSTTSLWGTWGSSRAPLTRAVSFMCVLLTLSPSRLADHPTLDQLFPSVPPSLVPFFPSALLLYFKARRSREGEGSERFTAGGVVLEGGKNNSLFIHFLCPLLTSTPRSSLSPAPLLLLQCLTLLTFFADSLRNHRAGLIRCIRHRS